MTEKQKGLAPGTWDRLATTDEEQVAKINFEPNVPVEVKFKEDKPIERQSQYSDGVYYTINVQTPEGDRVIQSSAITLWIELKKLGALSNKRVQITKKLVKGKNYFEVLPLS